MAPSTRADPVRDRIVTAATAEFARYGIAGARIDRIAKAAWTSKERVYAYFSSKDALYRFISNQVLSAVAEATRMDPADLPGYAGRVHDYFARHPERFRLMSWGQLELGTGDCRPDNAIRETAGRKIEELRRAQEAGRLDPAWDPLDILVFVNQIAMSWAAQPGFGPAGDEGLESFMAARRAAVVAAVQRLFPSAAHDSADGAP